MTPVSPDVAVTRTSTRTISRGTSFALDLGCVVVFVLLGRRSHGEQSALAGSLHTAWPFLTGAAAGAVIAEVSRMPRTSWRAGAVVLASTVVIGMGLRRGVSGDGTPASFIAVATTFLAAFLLGCRAVVRWRLRRRESADGGGVGSLS